MEKLLTDHHPVLSEHGAAQYTTQLTYDAMHHGNQSKPVRWFSNEWPDAQWDTDIYSDPDDEDATHATASAKDLVERGHGFVDHTFDFSDFPILSDFTFSGHSLTNQAVSQ